MVSLPQLVLSTNNLSGLPLNIHSLVNLEYLDISRNSLRVKNGVDDYLCQSREFCYLHNLQTLIVAKCILKHFVTVSNVVSPSTSVKGQQPDIWTWEMKIGRYEN